MIEGLNLEEDSPDLTDEEVANAIVTVDTSSFISLFKRQVAQGHKKVLSYSLRRRNPHVYCVVRLTDQTLVFQVDWLYVNVRM